MIAADTHVHLHDGFDVASVLDAAVSALDRHAVPLPGTRRSDLLCLTDVRSDRSDKRLIEQVRSAGPWRFSDDGSGGVMAMRTGDRRLHLLPGRQIVSMERLEVLALNSRLLVEDRTRSLADLIQMIRDTGGIPVMPWGVGKWTGARARVIEAILARDARIVVADNGNRWRGSALPFLIRNAAAAGNPVMAGSDALPLSSQVKRAGCAGIRMEGDPENQTAAGIFSALMAKPEAWARWNAGASAPAFAWHAIRMQF